MTTADKVVIEARKEIGYTERPAGSNKTKFAAEAGHTNGTYWCATFTTAILKRCGVPIPSGAGTASTRTNLAAWKRARRWVAPNDMRPGDVVFFHISGRNGEDHSVPDHTGIVVQAPKNGRVMTVEGNTSSGEHGSQDNGGGVYTRSRPMGVVIGAGRPAYNQEDSFMAALTDAEQRDMYAKVGHIFNVTAASGYIEKLVQGDDQVRAELAEILQELKDDPDTSGGAGDLAPIDVVRKLAEVLTAGTKE